MWSASGLGPIDAAAFAGFALAWGAYHALLERGGGDPGLNRRMDGERRRWMAQMVLREQRIVDTQITGALQNGSAFFASSSLIAIGAAAAILRAPGSLASIYAGFGFDGALGGGGEVAVQAKALGLVAIFGYAFFKFSWSYRLFNFAAILVGATPMVGPLAPRREAAARAAAMNVAAGRHFSRGQRALFFALAYLGWFAGPLVLVGMTL
ncbi:MAG: DUF599 family protein, partial [Hyphomicrobiales bacterium]|nr:DUF599 family protein [Hyphomicrobiales bacterium]